MNAAVAPFAFGVEAISQQSVGADAARDNESLQTRSFQRCARLGYENFDDRFLSRRREICSSLSIIEKSRLQ
jgi:hypothetical protein